MYATQASVTWWTWPLHVTMVIIGAYLIANLALAVIFINFTKHYIPAAKKSPSMRQGMLENVDHWGYSPLSAWTNHS